jgi:hypothetical protein
MFIRSILIGLAVLCFAGNGTAMACQGKTDPALDDNFQKPDAGWGKIGDDVFSTSPQGLVVRPVAGGNAWIQNTSYTLDGADYCVDLLFPAPLPNKGDRDTVGAAGTVFWVKDPDHFYVATLGPDGTVQISRKIDTSWSVVYGPIPSPAVKTGAGARNQIELQVKGNAGTLIVNDTVVTTFRGQSPPDGGEIGLYSETNASVVIPWVFPRVQVY